MENTDFIAQTADIVSAFVSNSSVLARDLPKLIWTIHDTLKSLASVEAVKPQETREPAVSIKKSITPDYLICLDDGKPFKSLKRHLRTKYNLSPEQYREKWNLPKDYPMVAPNYAEARSALAKQAGLGQGGKAAGKKS